MSETLFDSDLRYIENDIIAQQKNGKYCRFSRYLQEIVLINFTKEQYMNYWENRYKKNKEHLKEILDKCKEKFENGLTSPEEMYNIVKANEDSTSYKGTVLKLLSGGEVTNEY